MINYSSSGMVTIKLVAKVEDPWTNKWDYATLVGDELVWQEGWEHSSGVCYETKRLLLKLREACDKSEMWEYKPMPEEPYMGDY